MKPFKTSSVPMQVLSKDLRKLHLATQAARFARLAAFYFIAHMVLPADWNWQAVAALAAASAEAAFQQLAPQLPVAQVVNTLLSSAELRRYLAELWGQHSTTGQPQTMPGTTAASTPMAAPPGASPAAGTTQTTTGTDPAADPAQKPQAVPKTGE